jgi:hypothetical protein
MRRADTSQTPLLNQPDQILNDGSGDFFPTLFAGHHFPGNDLDLLIAPQLPDGEENIVREW